MAETIFQPILSTWVTVSLRFIDILFWLACAMWHIFLFISIVHNSSEAIYILFPVVEICSCSCSYQILSTPFVYHNTRTLVTRVCVCVCELRSFLLLDPGMMIVSMLSALLCDCDIPCDWNWGLPDYLITTRIAILWADEDRVQPIFVKPWQWIRNHVFSQSRWYKNV